jgi:hypothetical protein
MFDQGHIHGATQIGVEYDRIRLRVFNYIIVSNILFTSYFLSLALNTDLHIH